MQSGSRRFLERFGPAHQDLSALTLHLPAAEALVDNRKGPVASAAQERRMLSDPDFPLQSAETLLSRQS